jgi:hypothetical protein
MTMRVFWLALTLFLVISTSDVFGQPQPSGQSAAREQSRQQSDQAFYDNKRGTEDVPLVVKIDAKNDSKRGTADAPFIVKIDAKKSDLEVAREQRDRDDKAASDKTQLIIAEVAIVLSAITLVLLFIQTGGLLRTIKAMRQIADDDSRPWIMLTLSKHPERLPVVIEKDGEKMNILINAELKNVGKSPAQHITAMDRFSRYTELDSKALIDESILELRAKIGWNVSDTLFPNDSKCITFRATVDASDDCQVMCGVLYTSSVDKGTIRATIINFSTKWLPEWGERRVLQSNAS